MRNYKKTFALLSAAALFFTSLNPGIAFGAETEAPVVINEEAASDSFDLEASGWHWAYSGGVLRMTNDSSSSVVPESVKDNVTKIVIESGVTTMEDVDKCSGFPNLEEVEYKGPITIKDMCFIESSMYSNCPKLKKITIGAAREGAGLEIEKKAFMNCSSLSEISLGNGIWHFNYMTFGNCTGIEKLVLPADIHNIRGDSFIGCRNLKELELSSDNPYMQVADNSVYEYRQPDTYAQKRGDAYHVPCLMFVPEGVIKSYDGNYTIPKDTKDVQYWAVIGDPSLKKLTVASTVEYIQHEAFYDNKNLTSITLPKSLKRVGQHAFGVMSENAKIDELSEDIFQVMHKGDTHIVNSSITDVYYQGSEDDWKKIKYAYYSLDEGYIDRMSVEEKGTLYDHLEEVGLPANVNIHYNATLKDTDKTLDEMMNSTKSMSLNSKDIPQLDELGIDISIKYTDKVTYNGRKHTTYDAKKSDLTSNDIKITVEITDKNTGKVTDAFKVKKVKFKNNKVAADISSNKAPFFTIQLAANSSLDKPKKTALKKVNKLLKNKKETGTNFYFTIEPADISSMTSENHKGMSIKNNVLKFKTLALDYKYLSGKGEKSTSWIKLKPCKKNDSSKKGDYTYKIVDDKTAILTGQHNYKGTVTLTVK